MNDRALIHSYEAGFSGRAWAILAVVVLAASIVVGAVIVGFRGQDVKKGAASLAAPGQTTTEVQARPPSAR